MLKGKREGAVVPSEEISGIEEAAKLTFTFSTKCQKEREKESRDYKF